MRIVIVGAGIGGLTAAIALARTGHEVTVLERAQSVSPLGAGLQMSANARRVLVHLGLGEQFSSVATEPSRIVVRRWEDDSILGESPLTGVHEAMFGHAYASVARNDLARILVDAAGDTDGVDISFSSGVDALTVDDRGVTVQSGGRTIEADVVIGADGIHSVVRGCRISSAGTGAI